MPALVQTALHYVCPLVFGVVGALIVAHQPRNTIGWLLMTIALAWTIGGVVEFYLLEHMTTVQTPTPALLAGIWFNGWSWWILIGPLLLILVLFPTGRPPSPRWRWLIAAVIALFGIFLFVIGFIPGHLMDALFGVPWLIMLLSTATWCLAAVFVRYRSAAA